MADKKYILTDHIIELSDGCDLRRIQAVRDFGDVKAGDFGGYIQSEANLSHSGECWVYDRATVREEGRVRDNARVCDDAVVRGHACIEGCAQIRNNASVAGHSLIYAHAVISGFSSIDGFTAVEGEAKIENLLLRVSVPAHFAGDTLIKNARDFISFAPIGSRSDICTFARRKRGGILVTTGCFCGSLEKFINAVRNKHSGTRYETEYMLAVEMAKVHIAS